MESFNLKTLLVILGFVGILFLILMAYYPQILSLLFNSKNICKKERFSARFKKLISKIIHHPMKVIKGKFYNLVVRKTILEGNVLYIGFYIDIEDNNGYIKEVSIPKKVFFQLNEQRKSFLRKNITLYFIDYFFNDWEQYLDHYEIA